MTHLPEVYPMVLLSVKRNPLLQKEFKAATPSMCHAEFTASLRVYTALLKKEEGRITFKKKTNNAFHAGAGKARTSPYMSVRARKGDGHFSDTLKTFPRKFHPAAGTHQSAALAKVTEGKIPC